VDSSNFFPPFFAAFFSDAAFACSEEEEEEEEEDDDDIGCAIVCSDLDRKCPYFPAFFDAELHAAGVKSSVFNLDEVIVSSSASTFTSSLSLSSAAVDFADFDLTDDEVFDLTLLDDDFECFDRVDDDIGVDVDEDDDFLT
jgi:hypothetical protein